MKMKERVSEQKAYQAGQSRPRVSTAKSEKRRRKKKRARIKMSLYVIIFVFVIVTNLLANSGKPSRGYYNYNGRMYYFQNNDWYVYDDMWRQCYWDMSDLYDNYEDYKVSDYTDYNVTDFKDSMYYDNSFSSSSSDWDSDYSWDSDSSWNDSLDDWDSDW